MIKILGYTLLFKWGGISLYANLYNLINHIILMGLIRFKYDNGFFIE